jgi:hypothetical protein
MTWQQLKQGRRLVMATFLAQTKVAQALEPEYSEHAWVLLIPHEQKKNTIPNFKLKFENIYFGQKGKVPDEPSS